MRVLLTNMPYAQSPNPVGYRNPPVGGGFTVMWGPTPALGLLYIARALMEHGHSVHYRDGAFTSMPQLVEDLRRLRIDVLGVSILAPMLSSIVAKTAEIKALMPGLTIVGGGPHPNLRGAEVLREAEAIDYLCIGDGELVMPRLLQVLQDEGGPGEGRSWPVPGVVHRAGTELVQGPPAPQLRDLDRAGLPARELVDLYRFRPSYGHFKQQPNTTVVGSRGCPHKCTFCVAANDFRQRTVEDTLAEIDELVGRWGIRDILFYDEDLPRNREWMVGLCEGLIERDYDLVWSGNARVDRVDPELLRLMSRAGCWKLLMGLETGVPGTLRKLAKDFTIEQAEASVAAATEAGIAVFGTFMFGVPGETFEDGLKTIDYALRLRHVEFAKFLNFTPYPGTPFWDRLEKHGRLVDRDKMQMNHISFVPHSMTEDELLELFRLASRRFYRRPSYILRRLRSMKTLEDVRANWAGFQSFAMHG